MGAMSQWNFNQDYQRCKKTNNFNQKVSYANEWVNSTFKTIKNY